MNKIKHKTIIFITLLVLIIFIGIILTYCINKKTENTSNEGSSNSLNSNHSSTIPNNNTSEDEDSSSSSNNLTANNISSSSSNSQTDSEQFNFEGRKSNLPDQIILTIDGKSAVIDGRRINLILSELDVNQTLVKETVYSGGAIYTTYGNIVSCISFDEKFKSVDSKELAISKINLEPGNNSDISLLGISSSSTIDDTLNILGSPNYSSSTYPITSSKKGYFLSWSDVKIGNFTIDITAIFYKDNGSLYSFKLAFK